MRVGPAVGPERTKNWNSILLKLLHTENTMTKWMSTLLMCMMLTSVLPAQQQKDDKHAYDQAGKKLEALLNAAQIPYNRLDDSNYVGVITVEQNESERFHLQLNYLGDDPNNAQYQIVQIYFVLGQIPKGAQWPPALIKQINKWNADLITGRIIALDNVIVYTSNEWLSRLDADTLGLDAALGHYTANDLRKEVAPYLKQ
jgi:hypothetical protein